MTTWTDGAMRPGRWDADSLDHAPVLRDLVSEVRLLRDEMAALRRACESRFGPRDRADVQLFDRMAEAFPPRRWFMCRQVVDLAHGCLPLSRALLNANVDNSKQLGKLLGRLAGTEINGRRIDQGSGGRWRFVDVSDVQSPHQTRTRIGLRET